MAIETVPRARDERPRVLKSVPFVLVHLAPLGLLWTGMRASHMLLCVALYFGRMFFITAGYYMLKVMSWLGLVRDLCTPPAHVLTRQLVKDQPDTGMFPELALGSGER